MPRDIDFATLGLQDALDLAILIEEEAEERYKELAAIIGDRYTGDAADVFRFMAANESKHGEELRKLRQITFADGSRNVDRSMIWDVEAPDYGKPRPYMSPRQAFGIALESENKAYAFFTSAIAHVTDPKVKALFEELQAEELDHQQLIQRHIKGLPEGSDLDSDEADEPPSL